jgi:hypothetical protein
MHVHERPNFVEQGPKLVILFFSIFNILYSRRGKHYTERFMLYVQYTKNTHIQYITRTVGRIMK